MSLCKLGDHISIKHGYAFDGDFFSTEDNGIVLVTPGNFAIGGGYQEGKGKYYSGEYPAEFVLKPGDLIVTMTDLSKKIDTLGYGALVPNDGRVYLHNQRIGLVEFKDDAIEKVYLSYLMRSRDYQRSIAGSSSGSTVHHSSPAKICAYEAEIPDIATQLRVADILQAYDGLIENNRRQVELLEEAAQRLYKEWFIDLRFPGHEDVEIVDGLPEGWKRAELDDLVQQVGTPTKKSDRDSYCHYLPIDKIPAHSISCWDSDSIEQASSSLVAFERDDILFGAMRPYFHKVIIAPYEGLTRSTCLVLNSRLPEYRIFSYMTLFYGQTVRYATSISVGTTMPYVRWEDFKHMATIMPSLRVSKCFAAFLDPIISRIQILRRQSFDAAEERDRLLPKLMSGEIEV